MAGNLSGGEQQMLAIARGLMSSPRLMMLDEPASGLDPRSRIELRDVLRALAAQGKTVLVSSHILTDLERVVSHVAFMRDGAIQLFEAWDTLLEHFRLQPAGARGIPHDAVVCINKRSGERVVDMRHAAPDADVGRALTLDELFVELNA